jgi:hypothetical protein
LNFERAPIKLQTTLKSNGFKIEREKWRKKRRGGGGGLEDGLIFWAEVLAEQKIE